MKREGSWDDALDWTPVELIPVARPISHNLDEFLLSSEEVVAEGHGVFLVNTDVAGTLFLTNFRILFVPVSEKFRKLITVDVVYEVISPLVAQLFCIVDQDEYIGDKLDQSEGPRKLIPLGTIPLATIERFSKQVIRLVPTSRHGDKAPTQRLLQIVGKDMRIIVFGFRPRSKQRRAIFEELSKRLRPSSLWDLYAFSSRPAKFKMSDPRARLHQEYLRLLGGFPAKHTESFHRSRSMAQSNKNWRITDVNSNYSLCSTYPSILIVPSSLSDQEIQQAASFRARRRLPVITWCHPENGAVLGRSSQPSVGLMNTRSISDEKLVALFRTQVSGSKDFSRKLYIADARPKKNALANGAMGGGSESSTNYFQSEVVFFGIENIHAMRESFSRLREYLDTHGAASSDGLSSFMRNNGWSWGGGNVSSMSTSVSALGDSGWLLHIHSVLVNSVWIASRIALEGASVLVHCSDGWDRTTQLVSLANLLLDPYYRTFEGFQALVEKDWLAFGHPFADRLGMPTFSGHTNLSSESYSGKTDSSIRSSPSSSFTPSANHCSASAPNNNNYSPIFVQWVDSVAQVLRMYPSAFEFSSVFLVDFLDCVISCRFGNFLCNSEKERQLVGITDSCGCIWSYLTQLRTLRGNSHEHYNIFYNPHRHSGPLLPAAAAIAPSLWPQFHLRWACPSDAQGELEAYCRTMVHKFDELQKAKESAEEKAKQMTATLQALRAQLESEKDSRELANNLALRVCKENSAIKRAVESIGCRIQFSNSHDSVTNVGNTEELEEKIASMLHMDSAKRSANVRPDDANDVLVSISIGPDSEVSLNLNKKNCDGFCPFKTVEGCRWPDAVCAQMGSQFTGIRANYDAFDRLSIYDSYFKAEGQED